MKLTTLKICAMAALLCCAAFGPGSSEAFASLSVEGTVPQAANALARQLDRQLASRLGKNASANQGISLAVTVPVDSNNLERSNPLARQVAEDIARYFVQAGYSVQEIRKGRSLLFDQENGEMLLTRRKELLASASTSASAVLTGTYTVTPQAVRFNIRLVQTGNRTVLSMASISIPVTSELRPLLGAGGASGSGGVLGIGLLEPTVVTTLP